MPRPNHDPRGGHAYRQAAAQTLADSDLCHLCGHRGAQTVDHVIAVRDWLGLYGTLDGVNRLDNLAPAHGTKGRDLNPCVECAALGRNPLCNQSRGARSLAPEPRSRDW